MKTGSTADRQRGFALIATGVCLVASLGATGLAVDLGRMYITKNELQAFADAAVLAAALELDGTNQGLTDARQQVTDSANRVHMGTSVPTTVTEFSANRNGPWVPDPAPAGTMFVRVTADSIIPMYFVPVVGGGTSSHIRAAAVAGQVPVTTWNEGLLPFSPFAHNLDPADNFGFDVGQQYTLLWPSNPRFQGGNANVCPGDNVPHLQDLMEKMGPDGAEVPASLRGYIDYSAASTIRAAIVGLHQSQPHYIDELLNMTDGRKDTMSDALQERVGLDPDDSSPNYTTYKGNSNARGTRVVGVPINSGPPDFRVVQIAGFFLTPASTYDGNANTPFCAEYIGPYVQGGKNGGAGTAGSYAVRLVQ